jgi:maleylpyruvate isomerase
MIGTNTGSVAEFSGADVPRREAEVQRALAGLRAVERATEVLHGVVGTMNDASARGPSLLPGWTRGHVVSHLARNADALVNLLTWARTGVEHPAYASRADREADIEEGSTRAVQLLHEDLAAASARFAAAVRDLPDTAWRAEVALRDSASLAAHEVPWLRWREVLVHMVDLNLGVGFCDLSDEDLEELIDDAVTEYRGRPGVPSLRLEAELEGGRQRSWELNTGSADAAAVVRGPASGILAWLTGRSDGSELAGETPRLPSWI